MRPPLPPIMRPAVLPYVCMLLGAASFAVMAILTAGLKDRIDYEKRSG